MSSTMKLKPLNGFIYSLVSRYILIFSNPLQIQNLTKELAGIFNSSSLSVVVRFGLIRQTRLKFARPFIKTSFKMFFHGLSIFDIFLFDCKFNTLLNTVILFLS